MGRALKNLAYGLCRWTGATARRERETRRHVPILIYHGVTEMPLEGAANCDGTHIHVDALRAQLSWIRERRRVITLSAYAMSLERGDFPPPDSVVLTFDDGYAGHASLVLPLLRELDLYATFFIPTASIDEALPLWEDRLAAAFASSALGNFESPLDGKAWSLRGPAERGRAYLAAKALLKSRAPDVHQRALDETLRRLRPRNGDVLPELRPMTRAQLLELAGSAHAAVGSHTVSHSVLTGLSGERAALEIERSRSRLAALTGFEPHSFSYPSGRWNPRLAELVRSCGYRCAVAGGLSLNPPTGADRFALARLALAAGDGADAVAATLCGLRAQALRLLGRAR